MFQNSYTFTGNLKIMHLEILANQHSLQYLNLDQKHNTLHNRGLCMCVWQCAWQCVWQCVWQCGVDSTSNN